MSTISVEARRQSAVALLPSCEGRMLCHPSRAQALSERGCAALVVDDYFDINAGTIRKSNLGRQSRMRVTAYDPSLFAAACIDTIALKLTLMRSLLLSFGPTRC